MLRCRDSYSGFLLTPQILLASFLDSRWQQMVNNSKPDRPALGVDSSLILQEKLLLDPTALKSGKSTEKAQDKSLNALSVCDTKTCQEAPS